jgi:hypothetical protein
MPSGLSYQVQLDRLETPSTKQYSPLSFEPATAQQETNGRWMPTEFGIQVQER